MHVHVLNFMDGDRSSHPIAVYKKSHYSDIDKVIDVYSLRYDLVLSLDITRNFRTRGQEAVIRVAINGFGRIGRNFMRCWLGRTNSHIEVVGINDTSDPRTNAHLLRYDTMLGKFIADISADDNTITVNGKTIKCVSDRNPDNLPWKEWEIDLVIESTGVFISHAGASRHINAGAKKVLITAPGKDEDGTFVVGVNRPRLRPQQTFHH